MGTSTPVLGGNYALDLDNLHLVTAGVDRQLQMYCCGGLPTSGGVTIPQHFFAYNFVDKRWSVIQTGATNGQRFHVLYESAQTSNTGGSPALNNNYKLGLISGNKDFALLEGGVEAGTLRTSFVPLVPGRRARLRSVRVDVPDDGGVIGTLVVYKTESIDVLTGGTLSDLKQLTRQTRTGRYPAVLSGRYFSFQWSTGSQDYEAVSGVDSIEVTPLGIR
jgi:hypothetical protein